MEDNQIYRYQGNYSYFLEKRDERIQMQQATVTKAKNLMRTEIEWVRRMPKGRGTKAKYRVDAFDDLKAKASQTIRDDKVEMNVKSARLGKKLWNLKLYQSPFPE